MTTSYSAATLGGIVEAARAFAIRSNKHIGGGCSSAELMTALHFGPTTTVGCQDGDRLVLSKGHAPSTLYFSLWLLDRFGEMSLDELVAFGDQTSPIPRMPRRDTAWGIEFGSGALGQGLSFAAGLALADRRSGRDRETFVVLGDGESTEGQVWEGAATAAMLGLQNLTAVVDVNEHGSGITLSRDQWSAKWAAFGFDVMEVDGHDLGALVDALAWARGGRPACILAHTIKGFGLSDAVAGTNLVHSEYPGAEGLRPDLEARAVTARRIAAASGRHRGPLPVPAPPASGAPESGDLDVDTALGTLPVTDKAHTKKFMKHLAPLVPAGGQTVFVTPDALTNSALEPLVQRHGRCSWENPQSPVVECYIAEQDAASLAAGLTAGGQQAVLMLMEGFVWRMLDSIRESVLFQDLPVVIVGTSGGLGDGLGPMVQSDSCFQAVTGMVGLRTVEACDVDTAVRLFAEALSDERPTYLRLPHEPRPTARTMGLDAMGALRSGVRMLHDDPDARATIVVAGGVLPNVLDAARELAADDIPVRVLEVVSVTDLRDAGRRAVADLVRRDIPAVSVHNAPSSVLGQFLGDRDVALGVDAFGHHGKPVDGLYAMFELGVDTIVERVRQVVADRHGLDDADDVDLVRTH